MGGIGDGLVGVGVDEVLPGVGDGLARVHLVHVIIRLNSNIYCFIKVGWLTYVFG